MSEPSTPEIKQIIPGYRLERKIGQGGMGAVFLATQLSMDRLVALKILPRSFASKADLKERFQREARAAGALNHPNIVLAIDCQEVDGYCYLVMEYVDGEDPLREVKRNGPLPERKAAAIALQIAQGLAHAWRAGLVHRDVKPENFLVTADGEAKLCDLGIAQFTSEGQDGSDGGLAVGTPRYMSPEQAQGLPGVDFRTDIYSLGASLYHLTTGAPPFVGANNAEIMRHHVGTPLTPPIERNPGLSRNASRVVEKMMAKKPSDRYAGAEALIADLDALTKGRIPPGIIPSGLAQKSPAGGGAAAKIAGARRGGSSGMAVAAVFALLAVVLAFYFMGSREEATSTSSNASSATSTSTPTPAVAVGAGDGEGDESDEPSASATVDPEERERSARRRLDIILARKISESRRAASLDAFLERYGDTAAAREAQERLDAIRAVETLASAGGGTKPSASPAEDGKTPQAPGSGPGPGPGKAATVSSTSSSSSSAAKPRNREEKAEAVYYALQQRILNEKLPELMAARLLREFAHEYDGTAMAPIALDYARRHKVGAPPPDKPFNKLDRLEQLTLLDNLAGQLEAGDPAVAAKALSELRERRVPVLPNRFAAPLGRLAAEAAEAKTRALAVSLLPRLDPSKSAEAVLNALSDRNEGVRLAALKSLQADADAAKKAAPTLRVLANGAEGQAADPSPELRAQATELLARLEP